MRRGEVSLNGAPVSRSRPVSEADIPHVGVPGSVAWLRVPDADAAFLSAVHRRFVQ